MTLTMTRLSVILQAVTALLLAALLVNGPAPSDAPGQFDTSGIEERLDGIAGAIGQHCSPQVIGLDSQQDCVSIADYLAEICIALQDLRSAQQLSFSGRLPGVNVSRVAGGQAISVRNVPAIRMPRTCDLGDLGR